MIPESEFKCPRCNLPLVRVEADALVLHGCGRCGGIWLDTSSCERLVAALPANAITIAGQAARATAGQRVDTVSDEIPCPCCAEPMVRTHVKRANVFVDVCTNDGTWFDRGEMDLVAMHLHSSSSDANKFAAARLSGSDYDSADSRSVYAKGLKRMAEAFAVSLGDAARATGSAAEVVAAEIGDMTIDDLLQSGEFSAVDLGDEE